MKSAQSRKRRRKSSGNLRRDCKAKLENGSHDDGRRAGGNDSTASPSPDLNLDIGQVNSTEENLSDLCTVCSSLDFEKWLTTVPKRPVDICNFQHVSPYDPATVSSCRLCRFFAAICHDGEVKPYTRSCSLVCQKMRSAVGGKALAPASCFELHSRMPESGVRGTVLLSHKSHANRSVISPRIIRQDKFDEGLVKSWINYCASKHGNRCSEPRQTHVPGLKVIDCVTRLIIPFSDEMKDYLTLSYIWGTTSSHYPVSTTSVPQSVPKVISDAIQVTRDLGFRFLWIDRYCIPQDNPEERHNQIQNMGDIYSDSSLTLIAAAGGGPDHGLPGVNGTLRTEQHRVQFGESVLVYNNDVHREFQNAPWNTRGWTLQEGLLSKRRLVFMEREVVFQCSSMHCRESIHFPLEDLHTSKNIFYEDVGSRLFPSLSKQKSPVQLLDHICDFVSRDLTYDNDAINAMQGIFSRFQGLSPPVYHLCGLPIIFPLSFWKGNPATPNARLAAALAWKGGENLPRRHEFPSWTWAGWKHNQDSNGRETFDFTLLRWALEDKPVRTPPFGWRYLFDHVRIQAEFDGPERYDCNDDFNDLSEVITSSLASAKVKYLHIRGWLFRVPDSEYEPAVSTIDETLWQWQISEYFNSRHPWDQLEVDASSNHLRHATGLVLASHSLVIEFLIIGRGAIANTFERLGTGIMTSIPIWHGLIKTRDPSLGTRIQIAGVDFEYKEICLA